MNAPITQGFGHNGHPGTDYGAPEGTPIVAASDGIVAYAGPATGFGLAVCIWHPADGVTTTSGHMWSFNVSTGQTVSAGQIVAPVGSNGWSTGPHLHYEVRQGRATFGTMWQNMDGEAWLLNHIYTAVVVGAVTGGGNRFAGEPTVKKGDSGQGVRDLQAAILKMGTACSVDGVFGPQTDRVIRAFQAFFKVPGGADGVVGPATWAALDKVLDMKGF